MGSENNKTVPISTRIPAGDASLLGHVSILRIFRPTFGSLLLAAAGGKLELGWRVEN
jgi:hypothetical protein